MAKNRAPATGHDSSLPMPGPHESMGWGADGGEMETKDHSAPKTMHNGFDRKGGRPMIGKGNC